MNTLCSQAPGEGSPSGQGRVYPSLHMKVSPKTQGICPDGPGVPTKQASRDTCSRTWWQHATPSSSGRGAQHGVEPLQIGDSNAAEGRAVKRAWSAPRDLRLPRHLESAVGGHIGHAPDPGALLPASHERQNTASRPQHQRG